jgi:glycosyltransferase involved in cell wall biosynthesis
MTFKNQLVVPHGVHFNRIRRLPFERIHKREIIYMGTLFKRQGVQLVIESLPEAIRKFPEIKFIVIGKGPYELVLKKLAKKLRVEKYVEFLGYISNHAVMENRIARAALAVALYDKKYDDFSYYGTPGKIKNYLGAGVPIVMTDVPYGVKEIEDAQCGFIVKYSKEDLVDKLVNFFSNENIMKNYRINAIKFVKEYDWDKVFAKALRPIYKAI